MADMFFNHAGRTHSLRLRIVDHCDDEIVVWEGLVDGGAMFFFESAENTEVWTLFALAVDRYIEYRGTAEVMTSDWSTT